MIQLPQSDELNIGHLSRIFDADRVSNCYKFFWFSAILNKLTSENTRFSYDELINEMIADAWYMVTEFHLHLGPCGVTDNLEEAVKYLAEVTMFPPSVERSKILSYLTGNEDKQLMAFKKKLINNVPYCLQTPFYDGLKMGQNPASKMPDINRQKRLLYYFEAFQQLYTCISINGEWVPYLIRNREILRGWMQLNLIHYLQRRNPSVPGIADKLSAPQNRDIDRVRKYWNLIINIKPEIRDIYGEIELADKRISVDHFVPWQYVAHDELWNLHPTTKSINSSKSNNLPCWDKYFSPLAELEYESYKLSKENDVVKESFSTVSKYHLNNEEIRRELYCDGLSKNDFIVRLHKVIRPVYEAAKNSGFNEWVY